MCKEKENICEKGKDPKTCTPEQIRECHGDAREHCCEKTEDDC